METTLIEVDIDNHKFHLTMMDGSKWLVNPGDLPTVATWLPTSEVSFEPNDYDEFDYNITNLSEGGSVKAMQVA
jgi:hypothetical protein